ncbi:hypothetical protein ABE24_13890 [Cytobacillus firmus]|nr:hypothetical protein [Cytobacillus firmus]
MKGFNQDTLMIEETKAVTLFIWLFYIILTLYDLFYYFLLPLIESSFCWNYFSVVFLSSFSSPS